MDQETMNKLMAVLEFGHDQLQNPQDLACLPSKKALAVADDSNGLLIFSTTGKYELMHHLKQCADACSVSYNQVKKCLVVSVTKAVSQGDDTPGELQLYDDNLKLIQTITIPKEPKVRYGYVRWVTSDPVDGDLWLASGDNETAALWRYSFKEKSWKTIWTGNGDLEHPSFLPGSKNLEMIVIRYTQDENWSIQKWIIDQAQSRILSQNRLEYDPTDIAEPWSAAVDSETGYIYAYDYKSGGIQPLAPPNHDKANDVIGMTKMGQWTSIDIHNGYVYVSSSDERCIRGFVARK